MSFKAKDLTRIINAAATWQAMQFEAYVVSASPEAAKEAKDTNAVADRFIDFISTKPKPEQAALAHAIAKLIDASRALSDTEIGLGGRPVSKPEK